MGENPDDNVCQIALESAVAKAREMCGDREFEDVTSKFFGLDPDMAPDCNMILGDGIGPDSSMRDVRRWTHCRASRLVEQDGMTFEEATNKAWGEAESHTTDPSPGDMPDVDTSEDGDDLPIDDILEDGDGEEEDDAITMDDSELSMEDSPLDG